MPKRGIFFFFILFLWNAALKFTGRFIVFPGSLMPVLEYLLPLAIWLAIRRERPQFLNAELGRVNIGLIIILSVAVQPFLYLAAAAVGLLNPYAFPHTFNPMLTGLLLPVSLISYAVVPALCEEAVFRGYLLTVVSNNKKAVILSGLLVSVMQMSIWGIPYAFIAGAAYAFITVTTRSVRGGALMHLCVHTFQITAALFSVVLSRGEARPPDVALSVVETVPGFGQIRLVLTFCVAALIFLPVITIITRAFTAHNRQKNFGADISK